MQHSITLTLLAAALCAACDTDDRDAEVASESAAESAADSAADLAAEATAIHYLGERFTLDELGEAPPHLVMLANGELHGFDAVSEAQEFVAQHRGPRDFSAADGAPLSASQLNMFENPWWGGEGFATVLPSWIDFLGYTPVGDWNDRISSVYNQSAYWIALFEHANGGGNSYVFQPEAHDGDLRNKGWNDVASSYRTL